MYQEKPRYLEFPKIRDPRGMLTFVESENTVPFPIKRVYYIYNIPDRHTKRGGHAHKGVKEVIIALAGSFEAICDDGFKKSRFPMNQSDVGLYVPEMVWMEIVDFSSGAVCLVLSSEHYSEANYVRKYSDFIKAVKKAKGNRR